MSGGRRRGVWVALLVAAGLLAALGTAWAGRYVLARLFPISYEGRVLRIAQFHKGGWSGGQEGTRQLNQFALIFEDGFQCEATDTSFAAVREGDRVRIRAYRDVRGPPVLNPEWWECDEGQLLEIVPP